MNEEEKDMNNLIQDFYEYSTDYFKSTCNYYEKYLRDYQKKKIQLQNNWNTLKQKLEKTIKSIEKESLINFKKEKNCYQKVLNQMLEMEKENE